MSDAPKLGRKLIAELVGTFIFVFVGAGSAVASQYLGITEPGSALLVAALANGIGLAIGISATLAVSGGALNPAVVIGLFVGGKLPARDVIPYIIAELVGAMIAGGLLAVLAPSSIASAVHLGAPTLSNAISRLRGLLFELVMTFFLVFAVYGTIVDSSA